MLTKMQKAAVISMDKSADKFRRELAKISSKKEEDINKVVNKYAKRERELEINISKLEEIIKSFIGDSIDDFNEIIAKREERLAPKEDVEIVGEEEVSEGIEENNEEEVEDDK